MESTLPEPIIKVQKSLAPYLKQRQETALIRRLLAAHLKSHLTNHCEKFLLSRPLSLLNPATTVDSSSPGARGLQREYLRCASANVKARIDHAAISRAHHITLEDVTSSKASSDLAVTAFTDVIRHRQKYERMGILQDYVDTLGQKPAGSKEHFDHRLVLKDVDVLPSMPSEVMNGSSSLQASGGTDLKELVDQLEKSVLRAKLLLKREQKLLEQVRNDKLSSNQIHGGRLQALGSTRNELINWIEAELARAGDSSLEGQAVGNVGGQGKEYIDTQLAAISRQYTRYTKSRRKLIIGTTGRLEAPPVVTIEEDTPETLANEAYVSNGVSAMLPYLERMIQTAGQQKDIIQQKSHLTTTFAKQLKEAGLGIDRLVDESHLLQSHPLSTAKSKAKASFGEDMASHEKPNLSHRAQAWVCASSEAGRVTRGVAIKKMEEGGDVVDDAQATVINLQRLLATDSESESKDIWTILDGTLGVINEDGAD